jgi:hypothetical protein
VTRPTNAAAQWVVVASALITILNCGCGINRRYANGQIHQLPHTNISIEYAWGQPGNSEIQQTDSTGGNSGKQMLTIHYPHPSPKYGHKYAAVTLRRESDTSDAAVSSAISQLVTNPFKKQEAEAADSETDHVLRLTIPRDELEFLLRDLVADSYFDREQRSGDVNLIVTLGSRTIRKPWDHVSSFDQLAKRVIDENNRSARPKSGKVTPASAELLSPTTEPVDDSLPEPAAIGRLHRTPQF